jgi:hypothetical protein
MLSSAHSKPNEIQKRKPVNKIAITLAVVSLAASLTGCASSKKAQTASPQTPPPETVRVGSYQTSYYTHPLTSAGAKFGALPRAVQRTVLAQAGTEDVDDIHRDIVAGSVVYKIDFRHPNEFPPLYVAPDGSVLNPDLTVAVPAFQGIRLRSEEVPANVKQVIKERAPNGDVASVNLETWGSRPVYVVNFKDEARNPKLFVASDGTAVEESP